MKTLRSLSICLIMLLSLFVLLQCDKKNPTEAQENQPPLIAKLITMAKALDWGGTTQIVVVAVDPENKPLTYSWKSSGGIFTSATNKDTVTWQAPDSSGSFVCTVTVSDGNSPVSKSDTISVSAHPLLNVETTRPITIATSSENATFNIVNNGTGSLDWSITTGTSGNPNWIKSVTPAQGSTVKGAKTAVQVAIDRAGLSGGTHQGWLKITSNGGKDSLQIMLDVAQLYVDPLSLDFGSTETVKKIKIRNSGKGTLTWQVTKNANWISTNPTTGSTTTETDEVTVQISRDGQAVGKHEGRVTLSSNAGTREVAVSMEVVSPKLTVSPTSLSFGTTSTEKTFSIRNTGSGTLTWTISDDKSWISVSPTSGTTTTETENITVSVNRQGLSAGSYSGEVRVNSNAGNQTISVSVSVTESGEWLEYDDGSFEMALTVGALNGQMWTRFTRPSGWSKLRVTKVRVYIKEKSYYNFDIVGQDNYTLSSGNYFPYNFTFFNMKTNVSQSTGWQTHDITPRTFSSRHFFIAVEPRSENGPHIGVDTGTYCEKRSGACLDGKKILWTDVDYGIRIFVEQVPTGLAAGPADDNQQPTEGAEGMWLEASFDQIQKGATGSSQLLQVKELNTQK